MKQRSRPWGRPLMRRESPSACGHPMQQRVSVIGSFNGWDGGKHPMQAEENGYWYADVAEAHVGDQYRFLLTTRDRRAQAHRPVCPRGDQLGRQRHRPRYELRLARGRLPSRALERACHLRTSCRHVQRQEDDNKPGQVRLGVGSSGTFEKARRQCDPDHAGGRVCGRTVVGLQPRPYLLRGDSPMEALWRSNGSSSAPTSKASR